MSVTINDGRAAGTAVATTATNGVPDWWRAAEAQQEIARREFAIQKTLEYFGLFEDAPPEEFSAVLEKFYNFHKTGTWQ